jgi:DNA-binding MarR family transcriptional regulator
MPRPRPRIELEQAADALSRVAPLASRWLERLLGSHEPPLSLAQYVALQAAAETGLVGAELARRAAVSPAAVSQLLGGLEEAGLLQRLPSADDRRRRTIVLSRRGEKLLESVQRLLRSQLGALLGDLPIPEADALTGLLHRVEASLAGTAPPPPRAPHRPPRPRR